MKQPNPLKNAFVALALTTLVSFHASTSLGAAVSAAHPKSRLASTRKVATPQQPSFFQRLFASSGKQPVPVKPVSVQTGVASWYGKPQRTASGERFRPNELTAAHRRLPLGTIVRVTNLKNNLQTVVRINDRGPYVGGRIIDVSTAAARQLAMVNSGIARVRVEVLPPLAG